MVVEDSEVNAHQISSATMRLSSRGPTLARSRRYTFPSAMPSEPTVDLRVLEEQLRALATLIRYEQDFKKLKVYHREFELVAAELRSAEDALSQGKKGSKVLPFVRKPSRSA
jgi:hypothetical protein